MKAVTWYETVERLAKKLKTPCSVHLQRSRQLTLCPVKSSSEMRASGGQKSRLLTPWHRETPSSQYAPTMTASTSLEGLRSVTKKLIIPSDLMSKLQPRKKIPNTTVRESTHITAIWTILMMKRLLSSGALAAKPLSVTTDERLQHKRISSVWLEKIPPSVWLNVVFMSTLQRQTL